MTASISYINLSWAVVGIIDKDVHNSLQSMKRPNEPIEITIERYVIGYLGFWHIAFIDKEKIDVTMKQSSNLDGRRWRNIYPYILL